MPQKRQRLLLNQMDDQDGRPKNLLAAQMAKGLHVEAEYMYDGPARAYHIITLVPRYNLQPTDYVYHYAIKLIGAVG